MKTFFASIKIFYKSIFLVAAYCLLLSYIFCDFTRIFRGLLSYNQPSFVFLSDTLNMSIFCTVFFMFFSYILFGKIKKSNLTEVLTATKNGYLKLSLIFFTLISILIFIVFLVASIYNFVYPNVDLKDYAYLLHMISSIFVYLFIVPLTGALIGACSTFLFKPLSAYLVMVLFVLLSSPLASIIAFTISETTHYKVNISPIFDIFTIYPLNNDYSPIYGFGISLLPYKLEAILFWLFAATAVILIKLAKKSQHILKLSATVCAIICFANFVAFFQPSSKVDMSYRVDGTLLTDQSFYYGLYNGVYPEEEHPAEFQVSNYDLDIKVKKQLYVTAKLKVDKDNLSVYPFTLYHNYKIKKVTDQNGKKLSFKQEVDHVKVYPTGTLTEINFTYSGYNSRFYSNSQGIFLPGYFAYYPIAGHWNMFTSDWQGYNKILLPNEANFNLTINSSKEIFTNISSDNNGRYFGKTNGLTIMSGFFKSRTVNGIEVIYPFFNTSEFDTARLEHDIQNFLKVKQDDIIKKIFVVPNVNQKSDSIVAYSDYLTTEQIVTLPERYVFTKIHDKKHALYSYQELYFNDKEAFKAIIAAEAQFPAGYDRTATLYETKATEIGDALITEKTNAYLFDSNDNRSIIQFLNELS